MNSNKKLVRNEIEKRMMELPGSSLGRELKRGPEHGSNDSIVRNSNHKNARIKHLTSDVMEHKPRNQFRDERQQYCLFKEVA